MSLTVKILICKNRLKKGTSGLYYSCLKILKDRLTLTVPRFFTHLFYQGGGVYLISGFITVVSLDLMNDIPTATPDLTGSRKSQTGALAPTNTEVLTSQLADQIATKFHMQKPCF